MTCYVESNFILEITYLQEQHASCEELLSLAETGQVRLVVPAFCITEARLSLQRKSHRRRKFHERLRREVRELSRSKPYQEISNSTQPLIAALIESLEAEKQQLESVLSRLFSMSDVIPVHGTTTQRAVGYESSVGLASQDAVVLASILEDLEKRPAGPKCFLNRNSKDFANPDIYAELKKYDCKMVPSFTDGVALIRGGLSQEVPPPAT